MNKNTISEKYRSIQQELHLNPNYGTASLLYAPIVAEIIRKKNIQSLSDYGAGKKNLLKGLNKLGISIPIYKPYDPAFPNYGTPQSAELICCIDVLEHIEPELLDNVIKELSEITINIGFFSIHTGPAQKILSDGRNAHLIQKPSSWWLPRICEYFEILQMQPDSTTGKGFWVIVKRRMDSSANFNTV